MDNWLNELWTRILHYHLCDIDNFIGADADEMKKRFKEGNTDPVSNQICFSFSMDFSLVKHENHTNYIVLIDLI